MKKSATTTKKKYDDKLATKEVQTLLDSILPYNDQSTSSEADKCKKLLKRRDAVDTREDLKKASIAPVSEAESSDCRPNQAKRQKLSKKEDKIDDRENLETALSSSASAGEDDSDNNELSLNLREFVQFKDEMRKNFETVRSEIKRLRLGISYDLKKLKEDLNFEKYSPDKSKSLQELKTSLNLDEPFTKLEEFYEFDSKIKSDNEIAENLRKILGFTARAKTLSEAISLFIGTVLSPELQICFSGCGKPKKGIAKENFSATSTYIELKSYLLKQFPEEKESNILSKTSRWFSNAKDRYVGRQNR